MTGVLIAIVLCGLGAVAHSVYALAAARREPAPFTAVAARAASPAATTPPVASPSQVARQPPRRPAVKPVTAAFVPLRLRIAGLHVDAPVLSVLSGQSTLAPPADPSRVGWWMASAPAGGASGPTVVVGHIDSAASGPGALFDLDHVKAGQAVVLSGASTSAQYRVTSLQYYRKSAGLPAGLFALSGPARLVLISCGGSFDAVKHSYRSNVVVIAEPVRSGSPG